MKESVSRGLGRYARSGAFLAIGLVVGRVLSLLSVGVLVELYGAGGLADSVVFLATFPYWVSELFMVVPFSAAIVPLAHKVGARYAGTLCLRLSVLWFGIFSLAALVLFLLAWQVVRLLAGGLSIENASVLLPVFKQVLIFIPLLAVGNVVRSFLQAQQRYWVLSLEHGLCNLVLLLGILYVLPRWGLGAMAWVINGGIVVRVLLQLAQFYFCLPEQSARKMTSSVLRHGIMRKYVQALSSGCLFLGLPFLGRAFASLGGEGNITLFNYVMQIVGIAFWLVCGTLPTMIFPLLSQAWANKKRSAYRLIKNILFAEQMILSLCVTLALFWFFIIGYFYPLPLGGMGVETVKQLAFLCAICICGLPLQTTTQLMTAVLNARHIPHMYLGINVFCLAISPVVFFLSQKYYGLTGVCVALSSVQALVLFLMAKVYIKSGESFWFSLHKTPVINTLLVCSVLLVGLLWVAPHAGYVVRMLLGVSVALACFGVAYWWGGQRKKAIHQGV